MPNGHQDASRLQYAGNPGDVVIPFTVDQWREFREFADLLKRYIAESREETKTMRESISKMQEHQEKTDERIDRINMRRWKYAWMGAGVGGGYAVLEAMTRVKELFSSAPHH